MPSRRHISMVVAARFLSRTGSEAAFFIGIWGKAAYQLQGTATQLAVIMFTVSVASILGSAVGGVLVDRYGPRRVLAFAEVLFVPAALSIALARTIPEMVGLVGLWAFLGAPVVTAGASLAPFLAEDDSQLKRLNSLIEGAGSAAFVVGAAAGAIVARYTSPDVVFAIDAGTSLVAALLVWAVPLRQPVRDIEAESHPLAEFATGLRTVYRLRGVRYYVLGGTLVWMSFGAFGALEPLFFRDVVGTGVETIGWINTLFGIGMLAGAALFRRLPDRVVAARGAAVLVAATALGAWLYVGSSDLRLIAAGAVVWSLVIGVLEPLLRTLLHRDAPEALVGRVMGTAEVHHRAGELVPLAFAPALAATIGVRATLVAGGLLVAVAALASLPEAAAIDRMPVRRRPERQPLTVADEPVSPNP